MKRISSSRTFYYKRVFPVFWFGFLLVFIAVPFITGSRTGSPPPIPFFIGPAVMTVVGYFIMRKFIFDLMDEVRDDGIRFWSNRGAEQRVALADSRNANYSPFIHSPRVVLSLRHSTPFGDQVAFCAPVRFIPFASSPVIADLINRIDAARQKSA